MMIKLKLLKVSMLFAFISCFSSSRVYAFFERKPGEKVNLTRSELSYFNNEFGGSFKFLGQLGVCGQNTATYLIKKFGDENFVLKIPNSNKNRHIWIKDHKEQENKIKSLFKDCNLSVKIPQIIKVGESYTLEEYLGNELDALTYENLPEDEKNRIAKDIADFLCFFHTKISNNQQRKTIKFSNQLNMFKIANLDELLKLISIPGNDRYDFLSNLKMSLKNKIENLLKNDFEIETATIHGSINSKNVLYNPKTRKVAIKTDFKTITNENCIYFDFVSNHPVDLNLSYDLLFRTAKFYNQTSEHKIDFEKLKILHELGLVNDFCGSAAKTGDQSLSPCALYQFDGMLEDLNKAYQTIGL